MRPVSTHSQRVLILTCQFCRCQARPERNSLIFYEPMRCPRAIHRQFSILRRIREDIPRDIRKRQRSDFNSRKKGNLLRSQKHLRHQFSCSRLLSFFLERFPGLVYPLVQGSASLQARVQGREEKSLQPLRATTSAAEAKNCAGALNAGLTTPTRAKTARVGGPG